MVNRGKDGRDERLRALAWLDDARRIDSITYDEEREVVLGDQKFGDDHPIILPLQGVSRGAGHIVNAECMLPRVDPPDWFFFAFISQLRKECQASGTYNYTSYSEVPSFRLM